MSDWESQVNDDDRRPLGSKRPADNRGIVRILIGVIVLLVVVAGGLGFLFFSGAISTAQPTTSATQVPTPTPRPTIAGQPPAAATTGDAAQQAPAPPPQPIVTKTVTYGDWVFTCIKAKDSDPTATCAIAQTLAESKTKTPLFLWRIIATDKGLVSEWQTRTGIMVDRGISLDTGGDKPVVIPFQFCTPTGCQAQANLAPDFIDSLTKATKAVATVFPIGAQGIALTLSVKGLPDALAALKSPS